jgi:hypothetical protein
MKHLLLILLLSVAWPWSARATDMSCQLTPETHGTITVTIDGKTTIPPCFSGGVNGAYATILVGLNSHPDEDIVFRFLARPNVQTCRTPVWVGIDYHEPTHIWTAYSSKTHEFGNCTITQQISKSMWSGKATAELISLKGDSKAIGSPTRQHSEKDVSGRPLIKRITIAWKFDSYGY